MSLSDAHRAQLAAIADQLIPAGSGMPSASEADVHGRFLDEVLAARPDLAAPLRGRARERRRARPGRRDRGSCARPTAGAC